MLQDPDLLVPQGRGAIFCAKKTLGHLPAQIYPLGWTILPEAK